MLFNTNKGEKISTFWACAKINIDYSLGAGSLTTKEQPRMAENWSAWLLSPTA